MQTAWIVNRMTLLLLGTQSLLEDSSSLLALLLEEVSSDFSAAKPWLLNASLLHFSSHTAGCKPHRVVPGASEIREGDLGELGRDIEGSSY